MSLPSCGSLNHRSNARKSSTSEPSICLHGRLHLDLDATAQVSLWAFMFNTNDFAVTNQRTTRRSSAHAQLSAVVTPPRAKHVFYSLAWLAWYAEPSRGIFGLFLQFPCCVFGAFQAVRRTNKARPLSQSPTLGHCASIPSNIHLQDDWS